MSDESEHTHQQDQNSCAVLQVVVQFPGHPAQTQQADHLEGAEQAADALGGDWKRDTRRVITGRREVTEKMEGVRGKGGKTFPVEA